MSYSSQLLLFREKKKGIYWRARRKKKKEAEFRGAVFTVIGQWAYFYWGM